MSVKTANYALTEAHSHSMGPQDTLVLPEGAFVSPIDPYYLPRHIKEHSSYKWFDPETHVHCFTRWGIILIPKRIVRER